MALEPLLKRLSYTSCYVLFWLFVHFLSYALMGFTVYLQAKALSYDYTKVDLKLLCGINQSSGEKSCLMLPVIAVCVIIDIGTIFLLS